VREEGVLTQVKIERRPRTISKFETQGKLRQLLEHLMRCALGMPPAGCVFYSGLFREWVRKFSQILES
jgi:hypothetical protein